MNKLLTTFFDKPLTWFAKFMPVYWLVWWSCQLWIDISGALRSFGWIDATWAHKGNYDFLVKSLAIFSVPTFLPIVLLMAIIFSLIIICVLFCRATWALRQGSGSWMQRTNQAFIVSFLLWMAFFIADQLVLHFEVEQNHMVQASFEFLCFMFFLWQCPSAETGAV